MTKIVILESNENPKDKCESGDLFITHDEHGYLVYAWGGIESCCFCDKPFNTFSEALELAEDAAGLRRSY